MEDNEGDENNFDKFANLLQPIRDLADNWNIDIASELEDYLSDLENIKITFDGEKRLNFAQAALLIQGSACVYSKKVEYLYNLVFQTLDLLAQKKSAAEKQKSSVGKKGVDSDIDDDVIEFLALDDLEEAEDINLNDEDESDQVDNRSLNNFFPIDSSGQIKLSEYSINSSLIHTSGAIMLDSCQNFDSLINNHDDSILNTTRNQTLPQITFNAENPSYIGDDFNNSFENIIENDEISIISNFNQNQQNLTNNDININNNNNNSISFQNDNINSISGDYLIEDPFLELDPHEIVGKIQNFKKGKTYRIPTDLNPDLPKPRAQKNLSSNSISSKNVHKVRGTNFPEFSYLYEKEKKIRIQKTKQKILAENKMKQKKGIVNNQNLIQIMNDIVDFEDSIGGINDDIELDDAIEPIPFDADDNIDFDMDPISMNPENENSEIQTYEDLCRAHVENYLNSAYDQYTQDDQLTLNVNEWRKKLDPILEEQESRGEFDIKVVSRDIIENIELIQKQNKENFPGKDELINFQEINENNQPFKVCRNFVATLQLVNNRNLNLVPTKNTLKEGFSLSLLSADVRGVKIPEMSDYLTVGSLIN